MRFLRFAAPLSLACLAASTLTSADAVAQSNANEPPAVPPSAPSPSAPSPTMPPATSGPARGPLLPTAPSAPSSGDAAASSPGTGAAPSSAGGAAPSSAGGTYSVVPSGAGTAGSIGGTIDPKADAKELANQGAEKPWRDGTIGAHPADVYTEDWWTRARPILELHGYFRTRGELYHDFYLNRHDVPGSAANLWNQPIDNSYVDTKGTPHPILCNNFDATATCQDKTQSSANMRFRVSPELHISDNLRILSQIDMLDNLVLGSTPDAYAMQPGAGGNGYSPNAARNPYAPLGFDTQMQGPPTAGINSFQNSINVKRVWGEYSTPVGQVRFGRMPTHWGLGMVMNSGDGIDQDYQTTQDRLMFVTGLKSLDLYFGGAWDFISTGPTNGSAYDVYGGQPYNTGNLTNVNQWSAFVARRMNPDLQRLALSRGDIVVNGGLYAYYRSQLLDVRAAETPQTSSTTATNALDVRGAQELVPDAWLQVLYEKLRFEAEFATVYGDVQKPTSAAFTGNTTKIRQYGLTTETEFRAIEDKLRLGFGFGWASGDPWVDSLNGSTTGALPERNGSGPISTFRFNPAYNVDLIFFRKILSRVEGAYYLRPSVEYDFLRSPAGQKLGGSAAILWDRASEFVQTPGHKRDLGVELDLSVYYQAKDGSLNDDPKRLGGFYSMLQYGVFFPLGGLDYLPGEQTNALSDWSTSAAQTVRLFLGIAY